MHTRNGFEMSPSSINRWVNKCNRIDLPLAPHIVRRRRREFIRSVVFAVGVTLLAGATGLMLYRVMWG